MISITTIGRITKDLELKTSQKGICFVNFGFAVNKGFGDTKKTIFFECSLFGSLAERLVKAGAKKGSMIQVVGDLDLSEFERKDGTKGHSLKLLLYDWSYVSVGTSTGDKPNDLPTNNETTSISTPDGFQVMNLDDDELPF